MDIATLQDLQDVLGNLAASLAHYSSVSRLYGMKLQNQDLALGISGLLVAAIACNRHGHLAASYVVLTTYLFFRSLQMYCKIDKIVT
jgi:hypothetical protein